MNLANQISIVRILAAPVFVMLLFYFSPEREALRRAAIGIFLAACVSDAVDGFLARRMNQITEFGTTLDPIADKLLLLTGFISLTFMTHLPDAMRIPAWVTIPVIARDIIILGGSAIIFLTTGRLHVKPIIMGKITTVVQMTSLGGALLSWPAAVRGILFYTAVIFTVLSGVLYIRMGGRLLEELS